MIERVIITPLAVEDVAIAATWYEEQREGLGEELVDEVIAAIRRAQVQPDLFRIVRQVDEVRRVLSERFPFRIFFSVVGDTLFVHAVLHGARHDRHWKTRR